MTEYKWHEVYKAAVLETDWSKMEKRIRAAEDALHEESANSIITTVALLKRMTPSRVLSEG